MKPKSLTPRQKLLRRKYTKQDKYNNVWLVVDHQSFMFESFKTNGNNKSADRQYANWRRDQLAIAMDRMIYQWEQL